MLAKEDDLVYFGFGHLGFDYLFTSSLKLLFSPGPGLGAPLSSYLEMALYKCHRWWWWW